MKMLLKVTAGLVVLGIVAVALLAFLPMRTTAPKAELAADYEPAEGAGEYAMRLADCAACHTAEDGEPFAGGRPIDSPFGTIWSSNITPDPEAGIGNYTLEEFRAALYDGVRQDGAHLYPAMPYPNYRKISEQDVRALYDFFQNEVAPVDEPSPETELAFPFNQRWGIRIWDWLALEDPQFEPRYNDPQLDRGAYIVESLGHCGACHTPRNFMFAETTTDAEDESFLTGGEIAGWSVPDLRGPNSAPQTWSAKDLRNYLATGRNTSSAVTGEMSLVVEHSLQYASDEDLDAIVAYLRHIGGGGGEASSSAEEEDDGPRRINIDQNETTRLLSQADPSMDLGARLYLDNCGACHFVDGKGADSVFPALDGNSLVTSENATGLIHMILEGAALPSTRERPAPLRMPGFAERLDDDEVAALATFLRSAWSNDAGPIEAGDVAAQRESNKEPR